MSEEDFKILKDDVKLIKIALLGNDYNENDGLISKVNSHDKRLSVLEKFQYKLLAWVAVIVGTVSLAYKIYEVLVQKAGS